MKKKMAIMLSLTLTAAMLAACGGGQGTAETQDTAGAAEESMIDAAGAVGDSAADTAGNADTEDAGVSEDISAPADNGARDDEQYINALIATEPSTLDCARFLGIVDRTILHSITEPLTRIVDGQVEMAGAENVEISEDGTVYTFDLRENYWEDGQQVTAGDYLYALERESDPVNAWSFASDFFSIVNFEERYNGEDVQIGVEARDDDTLVITLDAPNPALLSTVDFFPCRRSDVESNGDTYGSEAGTVLSCGPFKLDAWVHNSKLEFSANDQYWDKENVELDRFTDSVIGDEGAQMNSLENGSVDYAVVSSEEYAQKFDGNGDLYKNVITTDRTSMIVFNCEDEVFANEKIRQAFSLALDRDLIIELTNGGLGTPAYGLVPTVCYVGDENFREATPEPLTAVAEANPDPQALLLEGMEEAGLGTDPGALTVSFTYRDTSATGRTNAELYQQMWEEMLGVNVEIDFNESALESIREGKYQIGSVAWGSTYEPIFQLSRWSTGGQSRWVNEDYAALVAEGAAATDAAVRLEKYQKAEEMLVTAAAIAPTYYNAQRTYAYNYVGGIPTNPFDTTGMKTYYTSGR